MNIVLRYVLGVILSIVGFLFAILTVFTIPEVLKDLFGKGRYQEINQVAHIFGSFLGVFAVGLVAFFAIRGAIKLFKRESNQVERDDVLDAGSANLY